MMGRFTEKAQTAINRSKEIAKEIGHAYVGTEHLLLGLLDVTDGVASMVLMNQGITYSMIEEQIRDLIATNQVQIKEPEGFTPRVRKYWSYH